MAVIEEIQLSDRFWHAYPIAEVGRHIAAGNGAKDPKAEWFNPHIQDLEKRGNQIPRETAQFILTLIKNRRLPLWVAEYLDLDKLRLSASS